MHPLEFFLLYTAGKIVLSYHYEQGMAPIAKNSVQVDNKGMTPMEKNIEVVDEAGNVYEPTWPKRAKGLVKHGRARFVSENRICLACPPDHEMEDKHMSNTMKIFGDMTVADILSRINNIVNQTGYITSAFESLAAMGDGDNGEPFSPGNKMGEAKANAIATVVQSRETTNQQILRLYEKMYDDLIRMRAEAYEPKTLTEAHIE